MRFDEFWNDNVYGFDDRLIVSNGLITSCDVSEILTSRLPGCVEVEKTDKKTDKSGVDWWAHMANGCKVGVDLKRRTKDCRQFGNDDVALESWSVIGRKVGWSRDESKACEWILWVWDDTGRFLLMPFASICGVFANHWLEWRKAYQTREQITPGTQKRDGWKSECVFVPRNVLQAAVVDWFNGSLADKEGQDGRRMD